MSVVHTTMSHDSYKEKEEGAVHVQPVGHHDEVELERNFSFLACLGLGFALLNSWTALAASLSLVVPSGGSVAMVWGLLVSAAGTIFMSVSLAEICHVYPMSGGQYDWTYCISDPSYRVGLSWFVGWMGCAGWTALFAAAASLGMNFVVGIVVLWHPEYEAAKWHIMLYFLCFVFAAAVLNTFGIHILPWIDRFAGSWGMIGIVVCSITLLACSSGKFQQPEKVFTEFTNLTGWPDGFTFILGLLQSTLCLTAFDAASHMVEEIPKPAKNAPRVMMIAVALGAVTSWLFMVVLLFCVRDYELVATDPMGPLLQIYYQATESRVGATCLVMFNLISMFFCIQAVNTVASRMVMSFARDRGLGPLSPYVSPVHPRLKVPVWSIVFVTFWVFIIGLIYLGSTVAINAILSAAIVFLQVSYVVPIIVVFMRGEKSFAGHSRSWSLGKWRRPLNAGAMIFAIVTCVCFLFPPFLPVDGATMNYAVVVVAIVSIMCGIIWLVDGRKRFHGPADLEFRLAQGKSA